MPTGSTKYCIVGAGIAGLSAAYYIKKQNPDVDITIIERSAQPGGLGSWIDYEGYAIEPYYHHFFESDTLITKLVADLKISDSLHFKKAESGYFYDDGFVRLSGPLDLLKFPKLSILDRLRVVASMVYLKLLRDGTSLDSYTVKAWMHKWIGETAYKTLWEPLMKGKFEKYADDISMTWMWGRIHDRSVKLGYITGGIKLLFVSLEKWLLANKVVINYKTSVMSVVKTDNNYAVETDFDTSKYDKIIFTTISPVFAKLTKNIFMPAYLDSLASIKHIGTVCLLITLKNKVQDRYWLNLCSTKTPYLIAVEHTNFIESSCYDNKHLIYLAKYTDPSSSFFNNSDDYYISEAKTALRLFNNDFKDTDILDIKVSKVPNSQTIFPKGYAAIKPSVVTPDPNIFLLNIDQTFPHDRNLNMGIVLASSIINFL